MNSDHGSITVTKRFTFEMAHALHGHDGDCAGIHGHSYILEVTLTGTPLNEPGHPKDGMIIDFADLKPVVKARVLDHYDHAIVLHEADAPVSTETKGPWRRLHSTRWQPTCENLLLDIVDRLRSAFGASVRLHTVRLQETASSWCEWTGPEPTP